MKYHIIYFLSWLFLSICTLEYSSPCLAGKQFSEEEFTAFTKKIEYRFENRELLSSALTHSSVARKKTAIDEFQRLEHLGDKVLNLAITDYLYETHPEKNEGHLAEESKKFISNDYVLKVATRLGLIKDVMYEIDESSPDKGLDKISYTACEALIGAIYKDSSLGCAKKFVHTHFILYGQETLKDVKETIHTHPKKIKGNATNSSKKELSLLDPKPVKSLGTEPQQQGAEQAFKTLKEFRKLCTYKEVTIPYHKSTIKVMEQTFTANGKSEQRAKELAAQAGYNALTGSTIGKKKAIQALETKFPQQVTYLPIISEENKGAVSEATYKGRTETGKGESAKKAKAEASKKLYEHFKS